MTRTWHAGVLALLAAAALGLGVWSLTLVDPQRIGGVGLIEALPATYFVALGLSLAGFVASLGLRRMLPALLAFQLLVLVIILHGADPIIHGLPRLEASYRHLGIADYIAQSGHLDPKLDAYFSWPGFFGLLGLLSDATGVHDLTGLSTWASLAVNVLLLPALLATAARLTSDQRHAWASVWVFYLASWVGQDYLSPQAYGLLLLLTLLACVLTSFDGWAWEASGNRFTTWLGRFAERLEPARPRQNLTLPAADSAALVVVCALLLTAITAAHQLTPFAAIPILVGLLLIGRCRLPFLPVLAVVLPSCWLVLVATPYLSGHMNHLFGSLGDIGASTSTSLINRVTGSPEHELVVYTRLGEAALIWALAIVGAVVGRRRGLPWLAAIIGAFAPFVLLPLQPYGGELLLRLYLFGLPFAACLVVVPLMPKTSRAPSWRRGGALLLLGAVLATTTIVTRYGNDSMETFTAAEVSLVNRLYSVAPSGTVLIEAIHNTPWRFQKYADYQYRSLLDTGIRPGTGPLTCGPVNQLAKRAGAYVIVTKSQEAAANLLGTGPAGDVAHFIQTCGASAGWSLVYQNPGGVIFHIQGGTDAK